MTRQQDESSIRNGAESESERLATLREKARKVGTEVIQNATGRYLFNREIAPGLKSQERRDEFKVSDWFEYRAAIESIYLLAHDVDPDAVIRSIPKRHVDEFWLVLAATHVFVEEMLREWGNKFGLDGKSKVIDTKSEANKVRKPSNAGQQSTIGYVGIDGFPTTYDALYYVTGVIDEINQAKEAGLSSNEDVVETLTLINSVLNMIDENIRGEAAAEIAAMAIRRISDDDAKYIGVSEKLRGLVSLIGEKNKSDIEMGEVQ